MKKIAIAGFGAEGRVSYDYFNDGENQVVIVDEKMPKKVPVDASLIIGEGVFSKLDGYDLVMRSPSIRPDKIKTDGKVWSSTNEFFSKCPAKIIAVTGTKGKGTTCSLLYEILKADGKKPVLLGNIGIPALEILPKITEENIVIFEMSSFQAWDLEFSPTIAGVLMFANDHLDVHTDLDEYLNAKANMVKNQKDSDSILYKIDDQNSTKIAAKSLAGNRIGYFSNDINSVFNKGFQLGNNQKKVWYDDRNFFYQNEVVAYLKDLKILGRHNYDNTCAAIGLAILAGCCDYSLIAGAIQKFIGLPHRLEKVESSLYPELKIVNDSFSTNPDASLASLKAIEGDITLILGGVNKELDFSKLSDEIVQKADDIRVVLMGESKDQIYKSLLRAGFSKDKCILQNSKDLKQVVKSAVQVSKSGNTILFSPACASFDMFENSSKRGEEFKKIMRSMV